MKVCVMGAGIIGCATAYQLARLGCEVQLVDAAPGPGLGTSFANGAQLSYSYVEPMASPATLRGIPGMLLSPNSPLRFRPQWDTFQWLWAWQFLRACTTRQVQQGTRELLELSQLSRDTLQAWMQTEPWEYAFRRNGKLVLCPDAASLDRQARQVQFQANLGCQQEVLGVAGCLQKEPALATYAGGFAGGVWTADECVADPHQLCTQLVASLQRLGGQVTFNTPIQSLVQEQTQVVAVRTLAGDIRADAFVLATGAQAAALAAPLGIHLPIYPIKGYSITLPMRPGQTLPVASVTDLGRKTVFAPLDGRLRVAAMAEIVGYDLAIPAQRIGQMLASVNAVFPGLCDLGAPQPWAGLRPATPTSIPIVGRSALGNLFLNVGHGPLGLTLAAGSAAVLARAMGLTGPKRPLASSINSVDHLAWLRSVNQL